MQLILMFLCPTPNLSPENLEATCGKELDPFVSKPPRDLAFKTSLKFQLFSSYLPFSSHALPKVK